MATKPVTKTTQAVATAESGARPSYLQNYAGKDARGNIDASDLIVPRIKLLQAISPEVTDHEEAKPGFFWHNVMDTLLGDKLRFIPVRQRKFFLLFAPRGDSQGVLARSNDAVHWEPSEGKFSVKLKGVKNPVTWELKPTVAESGLDKFGSSNPDDPSSPPAATLIYEYLVYLPDFPQFSPILLSGARSQLRIMKKELLGKINMTDDPMHSRVYEMGIRQEQADEGTFFNYTFRAAGFATEEQFSSCSKIMEKFANYQGNDRGMGDEAPEGGGSTGGGRGRTVSADEERKAAY